MKINGTKPTRINDLADDGLYLHGILEPAPYPFLDAHVHVKSEGVLVPAPHFDRRMMYPPLLTAIESAKYGKRFDPLLAEAFVIEAPC
jgi:hypothetical protein